MSSTASITLEDNGLTEKLEAIKGLEGRKAAARAVNKSIATAGKAVRQGITKSYELNQKHVAKPYTVQRATEGKPSAVIHFNQKYENLRAWSGGKVTVTPQRPGNEMTVRPRFVKAHAKRGQSNKALSMKPRPFVARMRNGFVGLFKRTSRKKNNKQVIRGIAGPAATEAMRDPELQKKVQETVNNQIAKYYQQELDYILKKK